MSGQTDRARKIYRVLCYLLLVVLVVLLSLSGVVIAMSLGPSPGDNMILMALPLLAIPTTLICCLLLALTGLGWKWLSRLERSVFVFSGLSFLLIYALLFALG